MADDGSGGRRMSAQIINYFVNYFKISGEDFSRFSCLISVKVFKGIMKFSGIVLCGRKYHGGIWNEILSRHFFAFFWSAIVEIFS